jgi:YD repeat-containing protein
MAWKTLLCCCAILFLSTLAQAQTATYHLHGDTTPPTILTRDPSFTIYAIQSAELKGLTGDFLVQDFSTSGFEPNGTGVIAANSTVTYTLWMKKTADVGVMYPEAKLYINSATGPLFCTVIGTSALTTTLQPYTLTCNTGQAITMAGTEQFYLWVGVHVTTGSGNTRVKAELDMGGTLNGADDSRVAIPVPPAAVITSLSPSSGAVGTSVTINGSNFGASQNISSVTFNGVTATPSSWSNTVIVAPVPTGATTGPVVVKTSAIASNGVTFTVGSPGTISGTITRTTDGTPISGALVEALQSNTVIGSASTAANGTYSITGLGAGTYNVRASATGFATSTTNGVSVTAGGTTTVNMALSPPPAITSLSPTSGPVGASVTVNGSNFGASQGTSNLTFNGVAATPSSWGNTAVIAPVPSGASTGPVIVTVGGTASNSMTFTVVTTGTISGKVTRADGVTPITGATVNIYLGNTLVTSTTTDSGGNYTVASLNPNTYTVEAVAANFVTKSQTGVAVTAGNTATVNLSLDAVVSPIVYVYDELGRLVGAVDTGAETAVYTYDAVGNLLAISRRSSSQVSVIEFTPNGGPVGTSVTIYGTGFSTTASANTVKFNGVTATVTSATATQLVTSVPAGATTGPITVTNTAGTGTSGDAFVVGSAPAGPGITSFTPTVGDPGATVTITGTNFDAAVANNKVTFNQTRTGITSATATAIGTRVPSGATTGHISVATPAGTATSSGFFFIPPFTYLASDLDYTSAISFGQSKVVTINTSGHIGLLAFDGTAGQKVSFVVTNSTIASATATVVDPFTHQVGGASITTSGGFADAMVLPVTGTYTIKIVPQNSTGSLTLTLYDASELTGTITPGGAAVSLNINAPGQNARLTFNDTPGHPLKLTVSGVTIPLSAVSVINPDGSTLVSNGVGTSGLVLETPTLAATGTYTLLIDPNSSNTGSITVAISDLPQDVTGTIAMDGSPVTVSIPLAEQKARLTFSASAGQRLAILTDNNTIASSTISVVRPGGAVFFNYTVGTSATFLDPLSLPDSGTYTLVVDPAGTNTGSVRITLYNVPADTTGNITPSGSAVIVSIGTPGQNGQLNFSGTSGQKVSMRLTNVTITSSNVSLIGPSGGSVIPQTQVGSSGAFFDTVTLTATGQHAIKIDPLFTYTGNMTVNLYNVVDATGTVTIGGSAVGVSITTPGQNGSLTFSGAANQKVTVSLSGNTIGSVTVSLLKADGTSLASTTSSASSFSLPRTTLPAASTYTVKIDPSGANTGNINVTVTSP